ncbi:uncharacterized protein STEHIDRAFT_164191, partial [Stereum hirsutum FP-91666 SS1]
PEPRIQNPRSPSLIAQADGAERLDRSSLHETDAALKPSLSPVVTDIQHHTTVKTSASTRKIWTHITPDIHSRSHAWHASPLENATTHARHHR